MKVRRARTARQQQAEPALKFPSDAVRSLRDWARRNRADLSLRSKDEVDGVTSSTDLAREAERTIERMSRKLEDIRRDASDSLLFPLQQAFDRTRDDTEPPPPRAA
jgi:hypothetical protein